MCAIRIYEVFECNHTISISRLMCSKLWWYNRTRVTSSSTVVMHTQLTCRITALPKAWCENVDELLEAPFAWNTIHSVENFHLNSFPYSKPLIHSSSGRFHKFPDVCIIRLQHLGGTRQEKISRNDNVLSIFNYWYTMFRVQSCW